MAMIQTWYRVLKYTGDPNNLWNTLKFSAISMIVSRNFGGVAVTETYSGVQDPMAVKVELKPRLFTAGEVEERCQAAWERGTKLEHDAWVAKQNKQTEEHQRDVRAQREKAYQNGLRDARTEAAYNNNLQNAEKWVKFGSHYGAHSAATYTAAESLFDEYSRWWMRWPYPNNAREEAKKYEQGFTAGIKHCGLFLTKMAADKENKR